RGTRQALFEDSWTRAERGDANDTRETIARLAQLRAEKGKLLGFDSYAGWKLEDQMAKTPENALKFMDALVGAATANAAGEAKDIPVWHPDVRVYEVMEADGKPLALWYCDYYKRDNKNGGAWMGSLVRQSKLLGTLPVVYNVANLPKPAEGEPALISFRDVITLFHAFG